MLIGWEHVNLSCTVQKDTIEYRKLKLDWLTGELRVKLLSIAYQIDWQESRQEREQQNETPRRLGESKWVAKICKVLGFQNRKPRSKFSRSLRNSSYERRNSITSLKAFMYWLLLLREL